MSSKIVNIKEEEPVIVVTHQIKRSSNYIPPVPLNRMNDWPVQAETKPYWIYVPPNVPWTRESLYPRPAEVPRPIARPSYGKEQAKNLQTRVHQSTVQYKDRDGKIYYREPNRHDAVKRSIDKNPSTVEFKAPGGQIYYREESRDTTLKRPLDTVHYKPSTILKKKRKLQDAVNSQYKRPSLSFVSLVIMALMKHPEGKCSCSDVYKFIIENFPFYETFDGHWKNAVRHNLANNVFIKKIAYNGRPSDYTIDPAKRDDATTWLNFELDKEMKKNKMNATKENE